MTWSIADTGVGQITSGGLLRTTLCYLGGSTTVRAVLRQDPGQQATAPVTVVVPAVALVQIQAINRASDHQPVDLQRVAGSVEITIQAPAGLCRDLVAIQLAITGPLGDSLLAARQWSPPAALPVTAILPWETAAVTNGRLAFPDGEYFVWAILQGTMGLRLESNRIPVLVANR